MHPIEASFEIAKDVGHPSIFQANGILTDANGRITNIVATDIQASNGIIHVIDRVILPR